jgi:hypothetical protein
VDAANTGDAVTAITYVQALKRKMKVWDKQVKVLLNLSQILSLKIYRCYIQQEALVNLPSSIGLPAGVK